MRTSAAVGWSLVGKDTYACTDDRALDTAPVKQNFSSRTPNCTTNNCTL